MIQSLDEGSEPEGPLKSSAQTRDQPDGVGGTEAEALVEAWKNARGGAEPRPRLSREKEVQAFSASPAACSIASSGDCSRSCSASAPAWADALSRRTQLVTLSTANSTN